MTEVRRNGTCPWVRPDGKTQVTVEYKKEKGAMVPIRVHTILISTQHSPDVSNDQIREVNFNFSKINFKFSKIN